MQKKLVPLLLCSAIGAVVVLVVLATRERGDKTETDQDPNKETRAGTENRTRKPADTPTPLRENEALRELERMLQREKFDSRAHYFRHQVCEQMDEILESEKLTRNLLDAIQKYAIDSDNKDHRQLLLPILRVLEHPEATRMIEQEYYRAKTDEERLQLLEAMAHEYHDPKIASQWSIDHALNGKTEQHRERAFAVMTFANNDPVVFETAQAIYAGTTRARQAHEMINNIVRIASPIEDAKKWLRKRLEDPRPDELSNLIVYMETWATDKDAANLEGLAVRYPGMGDILRQRAEEIRHANVLKGAKDPNTVARATLEKERREKQRAAEIEAEHKKREAEEAKKETEPEEDG